MDNPEKKEPSPSPVPLTPAPSPSPSVASPLLSPQTSSESPGSQQQKKEKKSRAPYFQVTLPTHPQPPATTHSLDHFEFKGAVISPGPAKLNIENELLEAAFEDFQRLSQEGKGIHGTVYKVQHIPTGKIMAMKEIEIEKITDESCQRIVRELNVLKQAHGCSSIVSYYGAFYRHNTIYILMQYMDVGSLDRVIKKVYSDKAAGPIPEIIVGKIAVASIKGLRFLKDTLHVIHRDVKPSNILMNAQGEIKVCDFSVSGELEGSFVHTYVGTMYYMAPERIEPKSGREYTVLADVWSLGVTLVELVMGEYPYPKVASVYGMLQHIVKGPIPLDLPAFPKDSFSPDFIDFLSRCLQKDPSKRASYDELLTHPFAHRAEADTTDISNWLKQHGCLPL